MKSGELDPRIRIRAALRCDGIGRLDCAEDTVSGERVAVRWLPLDANGDAAVKACEQLPAHPTLPRIRQTGQVGASAFVALDFPDGELLSARGEERLENEPLLRLASVLSDALATVHAQGVVHGEMSRDSVLMVKDGRSFLWDMPLVIANRLSDRRGENRLMQNLVKTAPYLAPERARGEGASQAGDVYALGAILCVSAGAPLPSASTTLGVVHQVARGDWTPRVPSSLPEQWRTMLERMVAREPAQRPTAAEVALCFARVPGQSLLPTVPEMPAMRLPPEILQAAEALMKAQVEAMRSPTREVPVAKASEVVAEASAGPAAPAALPVASDPLPELKLSAPAVNAHTLETEADDAQPEVVRIPTVEIKAILAEQPAAPVVASPAPATPAAPTVTPAAPAAPPKSVVLHDNLAVSADLAAAGAVGLSEDEVAAIQANTRKVWMVFGAIAGAALALVGAVVMLATQKNDVVVRPAPAPAPAVVKPAPGPVAPKPELDELVPLTRVTPRAVKSAPRPAPVVEKPVEPQPAAVPAAQTEKPEKTVEVKPAQPADFNFLDVAEAPTSELKRPTTEL
jgi:hypothetical protein